MSLSSQPIPGAEHPAGGLPTLAIGDLSAKSWCRAQVVFLSRSLFPRSGTSASLSRSYRTAAR